MKLPIIVFAAPGAGASMLIWIIKRLRNENYHIDDPLDELGTAHGQPLLPHWYGDDAVFDAFKHEPEQEQVVHAALTNKTIAKLGDYCSFSIYFEDQVDVDNTAVLCYNKIPWWQDETLKDIADHLADNKLSHSTYSNCCNISVKTMLYGEAEHLVELVAQHLCINAQHDKNNYKLICNVIQRWREGNNQIFKKDRHGL